MKLLPKNLEAIIFDLGGVLLDIEPLRTVKKFEQLTGLSEQEVTNVADNELFKQFERGEINAVGFRNELNALFGLSLENEEIDKAWNALLVEIPLPRLSLLTTLRTNYKTFILSNTNEIHVTRFEQLVNETTRGKHLGFFVEKVYYSHKTGMRKPDPKLFEMVLQENGLDSSTTLFVDDTLEHIEAARRLGLHTWHLTDQEELFEVFGNE